MGIQFNNIPGAGLVAPLFAFEVTSGAAINRPRGCF